MDNSLNNRYEQFVAEDFINDPFFQQWVTHPDEISERFWQAFLWGHPKKEEEVKKARLLLENLRFKEEWPEEDRIHLRFAEHLQYMEAQKGARVLSFRSWGVKRIAQIAAVTGGIVVLASILFQVYKKPEDFVVSTNYGELKEVVLPDSTHIVLNAHSQIRYAKKWQKNKPREVWLQGEAFFEVKHLKKQAGALRPNDRFVVYGEVLTVEVLGTSFNIRQRRGNTEVVLQSGKIKIAVGGQQLLLSPGDMVAYSAAAKTVVHSKTIPEDYAAWKEKKLLLNNPTLEEIVHYLEDVYGKKIVLESTELRHKKIEGPILLNNLEDALFVISTVFHIKIEHRDSLLLLRPK